MHYHQEQHQAVSETFAKCFYRVMLTELGEKAMKLEQQMYADDEQGVHGTQSSDTMESAESHDETINGGLSSGGNGLHTSGSTYLKHVTDKTRNIG